MPKIAICFFGITRSLKFTLNSIKACVYRPARASGEVRIFAHLYNQERIFNPRSNEFGPLDTEEFRLLDADVMRLESPSEALSSRLTDEMRFFSDPWGDQAISVRNLCLQLHSLSRVGSLALEWDPDLFVVVRPDLEYLDAMTPFLQLTLESSRPLVMYPNWQQHGGMNDRFAIIAGKRAMLAYCGRGDLVGGYRRDIGSYFNGERLLKYSLLLARVECLPMFVRARRVRFDGSRVLESFKRSSNRLNRTQLRLWVRNPAGMILRR